MTITVTATSDQGLAMLRLTEGKRATLQFANTSLHLRHVEKVNDVMTFTFEEQWNVDA